MAEQGKSGSAVHPAHDPCGAGVDAFGAAVVEGRVSPASTAARASSGPIREGVKMGQVDGAG